MTCGRLRSVLGFFISLRDLTFRRLLNGAWSMDQHIHAFSKLLRTPEKPRAAVVMDCLIKESEMAKYGELIQKQVSVSEVASKLSLSEKARKQLEMQLVSSKEKKTDADVPSTPAESKKQQRTRLR